MKSFWQLLKGTFKDFGEDRAMRLAAAMAILCRVAGIRPAGELVVQTAQRPQNVMTASAFDIRVHRS